MCALASFVVLCFAFSHQYDLITWRFFFFQRIFALGTNVFWTHSLLNKSPPYQLIYPIQLTLSHDTFSFSFKHPTMYRLTDKSNALLIAVPHVPISNVANFFFSPSLLYFGQIRMSYSTVWWNPHLYHWKNKVVRKVILSFNYDLVVYYL